MASVVSVTLGALRGATHIPLGLPDWAYFLIGYVALVAALYGPYHRLRLRRNDLQIEDDVLRTPERSAHLNDLHEFARAALSLAERPLPSYMSEPSLIAKSGPSANDFRTHYPDVVPIMDKWNQAVVQYSEARLALAGVCEDAVQHVGFSPIDGGVGLAQVVQRVLKEETAGDDITFSRDKDRVSAVVRYPPMTMQSFQIARLPPGHDVHDDQIDDLKACPSQIVSCTEAVAWHQCDTALDTLRRPLADGLDGVLRMHRLTGPRCDRCPGGYVG
ncbi:MAG TPA: hypothetical protein VMW80_04065 [Candidatus Dormibacteraeota bacterium]|nr:hypothetical protein [Candidatus Dormibacteraeota bacterium]